MSKVPSLPYFKVVAALQRDGWVIVRHHGDSHIQLHKRVGNQVRRLTIPAHKPIKRPTLAKILKQAEIDLDRFLGLV